MTDIDKLKSRLKEYLSLKGVQIIQKTGASRIHCPSPDHPDANETAIYYKDSNSIHCPVCATTWDIFEVAGLICDLHSFPEKINEVKKTLGIPVEKKKKKNYVALTYDEAKQIYTTKKLLSMCEYIGRQTSKKNGDNPIKTGEEAMLLSWGNEITGAWPYFNKDGLIELIDIRFEGTGRKAVISFYFTGKVVKCSKPPILLFNRNKLYKYPEKPRLIHEGAKCARVAEEQLSEFVHTTWNGGGAKVIYADFTPLGIKADIYIYPDDDRKKGKDGKIKPDYKQPGIKAAIKIQQKIKQQLGINAKIVQPYEKARKIKSDGADIVEALQVATPKKLIEYILSSIDTGSAHQKYSLLPGDDENPVSIDDIPFRILGVADDGYAYYIDYSDRIFRIKLESVTKKSLCRLAPLLFWRNGFQEQYRMTTNSWDEATDWLIQKTTFKDFNTENILGRGAWKNQDGEFCYWDGTKLIGTPDPGKIYERKNRKDIGIDHPPANAGLCRQIWEVVKQMNFETDIDCMYFMAWCVLAPFCGVLTYRPPILLTGESETGKSTIFEELARPLTLSFELTGSESTPAGCRQKNGNNAEGIIIEETDAKNKDQEKAREGFFSLMRVSFCENDPDGFKGTAGHIPISFRMKNMFLFISISPIVGEVADDKRLFFVNLIQKNNNWPELKKQIKKLIIKENCRAIRSRTWKKLHDIINLSEKIGSYIQKKYNLGTRRSHAEGLMIAAYYYIWNGAKNEDMEEIKNFIKDMYKKKPATESRNQADEIITRVLDESVMVNGYAHRLTLREIIQAVSTGRIVTGTATDPEGEEIISTVDRQKFRNIAARHGLAVVETAYLAIAINHHEIQKIIGMGTGYHRHFWRHKGCIDKSKNVYMAGKTRRCVIIHGVIDDIPF